MGLTKTLAMELGPAGVRVNCICPGAVEGDRMERVLANESATTGTPIEELRANYVDCTSLKSWVSVGRSGGYGALSRIPCRQQNHRSDPGRGRTYGEHQLMAKTACIVGGGVIGGGWAARFLLNGWNVRVYDPDPEAERKIGEVMGNARHALPMLYDYALPDEGTLSFHDTIEEAVAGADWIQESVPERLEIKHKVYQELQTHCAPDTVIGSSTSGFKPSELQENSARPETDRRHTPVQPGLSPAPDRGCSLQQDRIRNC